MTSLFNDPFSGVTEISNVLHCADCQASGQLEVNPNQICYCPSCLNNGRCPECTSNVIWKAEGNCYLACQVCGFQTQTDLLAEVQHRLGQSNPDNWQFDLRVEGQTVLAISPNGYAGIEDISTDLIAEIIGQLQPFAGNAEPVFA